MDFVAIPTSPETLPHLHVSPVGEACPVWEQLHPPAVKHGNSSVE